MGQHSDQETTHANEGTGSDADDDDNNKNSPPLVHVVMMMLLMLIRVTNDVMTTGFLLM